MKAALFPLALNELLDAASFNTDSESILIPAIVIMLQISRAKTRDETRFSLLDQGYRDYPLANKIYAAAYAEETLKGALPYSE